MRLLLAALLVSAIAFPSFAADTPSKDYIDPEATGAVAVLDKNEAVHSKRYMVSAAHPLAVEAGAAILAKGGNALDAAIATQLTLNVVEPQSSGIGGGGFLLYYEAATKKLHVLDGRETAPAKASEKLFLDENGKPLAFLDAVKGGRSVGVPGLLLMLETAHRTHGYLDWATLFEQPIQLAKHGFPMSPRLRDLLIASPYIREFPASLQPYANRDGTIKQVGETITNAPMGKTLSTLALKGAKPFYDGEIAAQIVDAVQDTSINPGSLELIDLKDYKVRIREAVCAPYRTYTVCSMPPPSSGGVTVLQALGVLEHLPIVEAKPLSVDAVHYYSEASKLAYADRNRYLADPDFEDVPVEAMLSPYYLKERASLVSPDKSMGKAEAGVFASHAPANLPIVEEHPSTTHISIVDAQGNAVSMTTSIENGFGSGLSAGGFLLNNQLTDFSFNPMLDDGQTPHPNRVEPGKRPRSSMSPTMVFDKQGKLVLVVGSPGGSRIIDYVLQTLIAVLDWKLDIQQAINLPRYLNMNGPIELEAGTALEAIKPELEARGHEVRVTETGSGIHGIQKDEDGGWIGGADPRREGIALGN